MIPSDLKLSLIQKFPAPELETEYAVMLEDVIDTELQEPYIILNDNVPLFTEEDYTTTAYEQYAALDWLGRCGTATACIGTELVPTEERGSIGQIKPSGWHTIRYDIVDGKYLYNRCHLIGYQ
ncbi:MAG: DNA/RNA non-specific endonuclease, partial [Peptococcaceae bacterium]|nr:DNA/RNA non-specific endonuclease [Peptococcaceae bacterium]